ncbi:MAG TPA: hypothetical protein VNM67_07310 [Thermoanaerobaculia bacterium]|nr:hypothetical protein [Thermoanaerobaculia bacterium]
MQRFTLLAAALIVGVWLLAPVPASAIPIEGCFCPGGSGTLLWQTTWGAAPYYTCSDLAAIGYTGAQNYADSQCPTTGVCSLVISNEVCLDPGCSSQHYDLQFRYKCNICID